MRVQTLVGWAMALMLFPQNGVVEYGRGPPRIHLEGMPVEQQWVFDQQFVKQLYAANSGWPVIEGN